MEVKDIYLLPRAMALRYKNVSRFPRLYRRGPKLITIFDRPASQDLALTPVFTDGELPLD